MPKQNLEGAIYGAIIGDICGLKYEGINRKHINKENILKKTFYNMYSDETEHLLIMIKSISETYNVNEFNNKFIKNLRYLSLTLPYRQSKATTYLSIKSLFTKNFGLSSQSNSALMRVGILGAFLSKKQVDLYVRKNVILTHNNQESIETSLIFAKIINYLINNSFNINELKSIIYNDNKNTNSLCLSKLNDCFDDLFLNYNKKTSVYDYYVNSISIIKDGHGCTTTTLLLSIYSFLMNINEYENGLKDIIKCGGLTDTNAFVYGMISGSHNGKQNISKKLINIVERKINTEKLFLFIKDSQKNKFKINFLKIFIKNIISIPIVILYNIKKFFYIMLNIKI